MANQFKIGDTVKLKSGGPLMTVTDTGNDDEGRPVVWCSWFRKDGNEAKGYYPAGAVMADDGVPFIG